MASTLRVTVMLFVALGACRRRPTPVAPRAPAIAETATAWPAIMAGQVEGQPLSREVALRAFASMFGPLPGVERVAPDRSVPMCAHGVVFALDRHWRELTPEQRRVIRQRLRLERDAPAAPAIQGQLVRSWDEAPVRQRAVDAMVRRAVADVSALTGRTLGDTIHTRFLERENCVDGCPTPILAMPVAYTLGQSALADFELLPIHQISNVDHCLIRIGLLFDGLSEAQQYGYLAHEVFHCFQYESFHGSRSQWAALDRASSWRVEGTAAWVGEKLSNGTRSSLAQGWWNQYFTGNNNHYYRLFTQTDNYAALGFYWYLDSHLQGGDPLGRRLIDLLVAPDDVAAFSRAIANPTPVLVDLASNASRRRGWGEPWNMNHPGITERSRSPRQNPQLSPDGDSVAQGMEAGYQVTLELPLSVLTEVLVLNTRGMGRARLGADEVSWTGPASFTWCLKPGGCTCPGGGALGGALLRVGERGRPLLIAATGAAINTGDLRVETHSLLHHCDPAPPLPPPPGGGPPTTTDSCLSGTWHIDLAHERAQVARTLPPSLRLDGVNGDVVLDFHRARGRATGDYRRYCMDISTSSGGMPVTTRVVANGPTTGTYRATGTNLNVTTVTNNVSFSARVRLMGTEMNVPVPIDRALMSSVVPTDTRYRCTPGTLEFDVNTGSGTRTVRYTR